MITTSMEPFTVSKDGTTINVADDLSKIQIEKEGYHCSGDEVAGATLTLTGEDGAKIDWEQVLAYQTDSGLKLTADENGITWTSGDSAVTIIGLPGRHIYLAGNW